MTMYYNSTTSEVTSVAPWGNHYYDDDLKAELFADWTEVADDYIPDVPLADAKLAKLSSLKDSAAEAYVAGFSSSATGASLWYDSDTSTQSQITSASLLALASATTFNTMYPSGLTIRAKASSTADDSTKVQCAHTASQIITLSTDMQAMLAKVKAKLWGYQETIYSATTVSEVDAVSWV